jgi:two-component system phosphate regulon sensor histidine kinase PhoR
VFENYHIFTHYVRGDRDRIQVIENLIVNSIKYGKTGGQLKAVVNLTKKKFWFVL